MSVYTVKSEDLLSPIQQAGITQMYETDGLLVRAPMGFGKTVCTASAFNELKRDRELHRMLVVAPLNVAALVWPQDIPTWAHLRHLRVGTFCGTLAQRKKVLANLDQFDIVTINVELLPWLALETTALRSFDAVVFDEITRFKNATSKRAKAVEGAISSIPWRKGLTGSIRPHDIQDVFTPMKLVTNDRPLGRNITAFRRQFCFADPYIRGRWHAVPGADKRVAELIKPWVFDVPDDLYLDGLPELHTVRVPVQMPERAVKAYRSMMNLYEAEGVEAGQAGVAAGKLQQIASGFMYDESKNVITLHEEKAKALRGILEDNTDNYLVAYWFEEDLAQIKKHIGCPHLGKGVSSAEADKIIRQWNAGEIQCLAVHPASVGHGTNLQGGGNKIIWYTGTYSGELREQLIARLRRRGQASAAVTSIELVAAEIDERVRLVAEGHLAAQDIFVGLLRG